MNPKRLEPFKKAYEMRLKNELKFAETQAYIGGFYVRAAIGSTFGKAKFPEKPIGFFDDVKQNDEELTEEEIEKRREALILSLKMMQTNFEVQKIQDSN